MKKKHKITIEVVKNRNDALTRFNTYKTQAKATGTYLPNTSKTQVGGGVGVTTTSCSTLPKR